MQAQSALAVEVVEPARVARIPLRFRIAVRAVQFPKPRQRTPVVEVPGVAAGEDDVAALVGVERLAPCIVATREVLGRFLLVIGRAHQAGVECGLSLQSALRWSLLSLRCTRSRPGNGYEAGTIQLATGTIHVTTDSYVGSRGGFGFAAADLHRGQHQQRA